MDATQPTFESVLATVQEAVNAALRNEKQNVPEHVPHPPFEFGYIEGSTEPNACAISIGGCSYIGITKPLVRLSLKACEQLGKSEAIAEFLGLPCTPERHDAAYTVTFLMQLAFVVSHEFTHHVHGHTENAPIGGDNGNLQEQVTEIDADGYGAFHVLSHFIDGEGRTHAVDLLHCKDKQTSEQDEILLSLVVISIAALLFVTEPIVIEPSKVYELKHPPQAVRMEFLLRNVMRWIGHFRTALEGAITPARLRMMWKLAAGATWGMNGGRDWSEQVAFAKSETGSKYVERLEVLVNGVLRS